MLILMNQGLKIDSASLNKLASMMQKGAGDGASHVILSIVPLIGVLFGAFLLFSLFFFYHRQKMLMIEKGMYRPLRLNWRLILVLTGFITLMSGIAISAVFFINGNYGHELLGGFIPAGVGAAFLLSYFIGSKVKSDRNTTHRSS